MNLKYIKTITCPHCKCYVIVSESLEVGSDGTVSVHVNGSTWERRRFECGYERSYIPNFSHEVTINFCTRDSKYREINAKLEEVKKRIASLEEEKFKLYKELKSNF